jgi:hypothetical protein
MASSILRVNRTIPRMAASFLVAVILVYLGLIGQGQWLPDEYDDFGRLARDGWHALALRLEWSPRPLSELVFYGYGWLVNHSHRSLIIPFLALLWAGFLCAGLLTYWQSRRHRDRHDKIIAPELLAGLALMASFLADGEVMEVFYWPAGAVAYLLTLSATLLLFLQVARGRLAMPEGPRLCGLCLLVAACSSEVGTTFVLAYAAIQALLWTIDALQNKGSEVARNRCLWWIIPGLPALMVLLILQMNRFHAVEHPIIYLPGTWGHPLASLIAGLRELALELFGVKLNAHGGLALNGRFASETLLAIGLAIYWSRFGRLARAVARQTIALSAAFLLASWLTIAASELHFGAVCCQRHEVIRRCWILMALTGIAIVGLNSAAQRLRQNAVLNVAPLLLCMAIIVAWHTKPVIRQYRIYGAMDHEMNENFRSGFNPDNAKMIFLSPPPSGLIHGAQIAPGLYTRSSPGEGYPQYILTFFGKERMVVRSADDWLYHGEQLVPR